jgi:hypothetical protein
MSGVVAMHMSRVSGAEVKHAILPTAVAAGDMSGIIPTRGILPTGTGLEVDVGDKQSAIILSGSHEELRPAIRGLSGMETNGAQASNGCAQFMNHGLGGRRAVPDHFG